MKRQVTVKRTGFRNSPFRPVSFLTIAILVVGLGGIATAGPKDLKTNYYVKIQLVNGQNVSAPVTAVDDTGGTTSLSFVDATSDGLLNAAGDPTRPPDSIVTIGGTGGGSVKAFVFNDVQIKVAPTLYGGKRSHGESRTVMTTVVVPEKPADQPSNETDPAKRAADQQRKTSSLTTKIGKNTAGLKFGNGRLMSIDDGAILHGLPDNRYTTWSDPQPQRVFPLKWGGGGSLEMEGVLLNRTYFDPRVGTGSASVVPSAVAAELGISPIGRETLSSETQSSLFYAGLIDTLPGTPLTLSFGLVSVTLPSTTGPFSVGTIEVLINPESDQLYLGANGLVPEYYGGWFDADSSTFNLAPVPEPSSLLLLGSGFLGLGGFLRKRLSARS